MMRRRTLLSAIALGPVAVSLAPLASARADDTHRAPMRAGLPGGSAGATVVLAPAEPISRDLELAGGFRVVGAYGVHYGALPFVLEGEGARFQVDVLRRDPGGVSGVFDTESFSLFVTNHGSATTQAAHERGARALGAALQRRVVANVAVPQLASFTERRDRHPGAAFEIDRALEA